MVQKQASCAEIRCSLVMSGSYNRHESVLPCRKVMKRPIGHNGTAQPEPGCIRPIGHHRGNKSTLSSWARFVALYATAQAAAVSSDRPGDAFGRSAIIAETRAHSAAGRALSRFMQLLRQPPSAVIGPGMHSADRPSLRKQEHTQQLGALCRALCNCSGSRRQQ
jgi:hypothetical protein